MNSVGFICSLGLCLTEMIYQSRNAGGAFHLLNQNYAFFKNRPPCQLNPAVILGIHHEKVRYHLLPLRFVTLLDMV